MYISTLLPKGFAELSFELWKHFSKFRPPPLNFMETSLMDELNAARFDIY